MRTGDAAEEAVNTSHISPVGDRNLLLLSQDTSGYAMSTHQVELVRFDGDVYRSTFLQVVVFCPEASACCNEACSWNSMSKASAGLGMRRGGQQSAPFNGCESVR